MLTISDAQVAQEGLYQVIVTNAVGFVTSAAAFVRVFPSAPAIISHPASLSLPASINHTFSIVASGSQPLGYRWLFNRTPIDRGNGAQLNLTNVQSGDAGKYRVIVSNGLGAATSMVATLTVTPFAPYFVTQPAGASLAVGSIQTFTGPARGTEPIRYQWQHDGTPVPGATESTLTITTVRLSDSGGYRLVASNVAGMATSLVAQLTVHQSPTLLRGLSDEVVDAGNTLRLSVAASASPAPTYAWQFNGAPVA